MTIRTKRVYDAVSADDGTRVLVDRIWPRGMRKADAAIDHWLKEVAPSTSLRKWFGHDPTRFEEFAGAYRDELDARPEAVGPLVELARGGDVTLVHGARDREHNHARVLAEYLHERLARGT